MGAPADHADPPPDPAPTSAAEVERKFEPPPGFRLPDLASVPGVAAVSAPQTEELDATYYDTADLRLAVNKLTLRRRTGGHDAGWHLKRPRRDGERDELQVPLGDSPTTVPAALRALVAEHLEGAPLVPAVRLATTRTLRRLLAADGSVLAEVAQDDVTAVSPPDADAVTTWNEIEVELVAGDRALLAEVSRRLVMAGAPPSGSASKLARALGDRLAAARRGC
jgi:inorganic triphosphatase YgiF